MIAGLGSWALVVSFALRSEIAVVAACGSVSALVFLSRVTLVKCCRRFLIAFIKLV